MPGQLLIKRFSPIFIYFSKVGMNFFTPAQQIQILWVKAAKPWCLIFSWTGSTRSKVPTSPLDWSSPHLSLDWSSPHLSLDSSYRHLLSQLLQCKTGPVTGPALSFVNITTNATHSSVRIRQMPRIHLWIFCKDILELWLYCAVDSYLRTLAVLLRCMCSG